MAIQSSIDQETRLSVAAVLAEHNPQAAEEIADPANTLTPAEVLQKYVTQKLLSAATADALMNVLASQGYMEVLAKPVVLVTNNREAQIKTSSGDYYEPAVEPGSPPRRIELGLSLRVKPHVPDPPADRVRLEIALERTEQTPPEVEPPGVRSTEIASTVTVLEDHYFSLLIQPDGGDATESQDAESMLVVVKPRVTVPDAAADDAAAEPPAAKDRPRQVLLDIRTIRMEYGDLLTADIGWGFPTGSIPALRDFGSASTPEDDLWPWGIQIGSIPDETETDALLTTIDRLCTHGRAEFLCSQRLTALEGTEARFRAVTEEPHLVQPREDPPAPKTLVTITSGTVITITPRVGETNEITLDMAVECSNRIPQDAGNNSDLPRVTRRTTRGTATLADGGTVALAGLVANRGDPSPRLAIILVTARLIGDEEVPPPATQTDNYPPVSLPARADSVPSNSVPAPLAVERQQPVSSDPRIRALNEEIARLEVELVAARQTKMEDHPALAAIRSHIDALEQRAGEMRKELNGQADARPVELSQPSPPAPARVTGRIASDGATFSPPPTMGGMGTTSGNLGAASEQGQVAGAPVGLPEDPNQPAVQVGTRLLPVSDAFLDALESGLPLKGVTSPADANALHAIGEQMAEAGQAILDRTQVDLLLKAVHAADDARSLASPQMTVLVDETACMTLSSKLRYTEGYSEPNDASGEPIPNMKEVGVGLEMTMTPTILPEGLIGLDTNMTLTNVEGYEERTYKNRLKYRVPKINRIDLPLKELSIPDGESIILVGPRVTLALDSDNIAASSPRLPLLILFTVKQTAIDRPDARAAMGGLILPTPDRN